MICMLGILTAAYIGAAGPGESATALVSNTKYAIITVFWQCASVTVPKSFHHV